MLCGHVVVWRRADSTSKTSGELGGTAPAAASPYASAAGTCSRASVPEVVCVRALVVVEGTLEGGRMQPRGRAEQDVAHIYLYYVLRSMYKHIIY